MRRIALIEDDSDIAFTVRGAKARTDSWPCSAAGSGRGATFVVRLP